jgi:uncharacterized repeat protein (TIGR01451 family)
VAVVPPLTTQLLFVRLAGPEGMLVTFYRGDGTAQTLPAPFTVGLRPGYLYQVKLSGMARYPGLSFFPTLDVRGGIRAEAHLNPANYPATLNFTEDDFRAVVRETLITKAVVLERPDRALPYPTQVDRPIDLLVPPRVDPVAEAGEHGRVVLVVRLGERDWTDSELAARGIAGTVLLPGEQDLPPAAAPPWHPWSCFPLLYDPLHGPEHASEEMCIPDGGDSGTPVGFNAEGKLSGLDPTDTVAEYSDSLGYRRLAVSNRVCLCVPRFLVFRGELQPQLQQIAVIPGRVRVTETGLVLETERVPVVEKLAVPPITMAGRQMPSAALLAIGPMVVGQIEGLDIIGLARTPGNVTGACPPEAELCEKPLIIIKWPDKCAALIGDLVTFTLRYSNHGGKPITNVVVLDSLAGRYEFVPGSSHSDRPVTFTTQPNEAGSLVLRWQVNGPLPPGESGTITFQVRIR